MGVPRPQCAASCAGASLNYLRTKYPAMDRAGKDIPPLLTLSHIFLTTFVFDTPSFFTIAIVLYYRFFLGPRPTTCH